MRCTSPRTVGFQADGMTIAWSKKNYSKEYATFQLPCGKCLDCRLIYAREWAVRCTHEAEMHSENSFITLTYNDENLKSPKLDYRDWQNFMKKIRKLKNEPIGVFVTGEYGEKTKRPHWHACIFGWLPGDGRHKYTNDRGDKVFESDLLSKTWGKGIAEYGSVTMESAGYCARYAAKKLAHGQDDLHEFHPISKKSSKQAIGKRWLEKFWPDVFNYGKLFIKKKDGVEAIAIPRYYERWFKEAHPEAWAKYITEIKIPLLESMSKKTEEEEREFWSTVHSRLYRNARASTPLTPNQVRREIMQKTFNNQLQNYLKL